ncbi:MAG TPA: cupredoxin domain-containing protein [Stellaceae bacterium]
MQHRSLRHTVSIVLAIAAIGGSGAVSLRTARAADEPAYILTVKDHRFDPTELTIPANTKVAITVKNLDPTPEEFESTELRREKVVAGGQEIVVYIGPLRPGRYEFFGDFNPKTARGHIVAK